MYFFQCLKFGVVVFKCYKVIIIIIHEYYYGGTVALLLQDHLTMSVTEQSQYLPASVQREHKTNWTKGR